MDHAIKMIRVVVSAGQGAPRNLVRRDLETPNVNTTASYEHDISKEVVLVNTLVDS